MADQADLKVVISGDSSSAENSINSFGSSLGAINPLAIAAGEVIADLAEKVLEIGKDFIEAGFEAAQNLQFIKGNLDNLTGSAKQTDDELSKLQDLTEKGIFKPEQLEGYLQRLLQMKVPQKDINDLMHNMAAAAVGSSGSLNEASGKMQTLTNLFGFITDKGGLTVGMLSRFSKSLGIPLVDTLAQQMGMTTQQFEDLGAKTKITSADLEKAFKTMATGGGEFAKSINTASDSMEARQQSLKTRFEELGLSILGVSKDGDVIKGGLFDKISQGLNQVITFLDAHKKDIENFGKAIITVIGDISKKVQELSDFYQKHKEIINIVLGFVGLLIAQFLILSGAMGIVTIATGILGIAVALLTSPIFLVMAAIALLVLAGYELMKHWDLVKKTATDVWNGVVGIVKGAVSSAGAFIRSFINGVIDDINRMIGGVNSISGKLKLPALPTIPHLASGTSNFGGGMALVGEQGPELVNLPQGSQVIPNGKTQSMLNGANTTVNIYNPSVRSDQDIRDITDQIMRVLGRQSELVRLGAL